MHLQRAALSCIPRKHPAPSCFFTSTSKTVVSLAGGSLHAPCPRAPTASVRYPPEHLLGLLLPPLKGAAGDLGCALTAPWGRPRHLQVAHCRCPLAALAPHVTVPLPAPALSLSAPSRGWHVGSRQTRSPVFGGGGGEGM